MKEKYIIRGYVKNSVMVLESKAVGKEQASRYAKYMLEIPEVYKVEIELKEDQDC